MNEIDDIKSKLDVVDLISDTVTLKKSGRNYTGFCPFHSNTKPPPLLFSLIPKPGAVLGPVPTVVIYLVLL